MLGIYNSNIKFGQENYGKKIHDVERLRGGREEKRDPGEAEVHP